MNLVNYAKYILPSVGAFLMILIGSVYLYRWYRVRVDRFVSRVETRPSSCHFRHEIEIRPFPVLIRTSELLCVRDLGDHSHDAF